MYVMCWTAGQKDLRKLIAWWFEGSGYTPKACVTRTHYDLVSSVADGAYLDALSTAYAASSVVDAEAEGEADGNEELEVSVQMRLMQKGTR